MAIERIGNLGYCAFVSETTAGTAVIPTVFTLLQEETMTTNYNLETQDPIFGYPAATYQVLAGQRSHKGDITIVAEPNTAAQLIDSLLTRGATQLIYTFTVTSANATIGATYTNNSQTFTVQSTIAAQTTLISAGTGAPLASGTLTKASGTGDATITYSANVAGANLWPFTLSAATLPKSKTMDISTVNVVKRFTGVQCSKITMSQSKNQIMLKASLSALGSFQGGLISAITGAGPYTVTFDTTYDPNPTQLLVVGDLIRFYHQATGVTTDATVASIVNASQFTTATNPTPSIAGDMVYLRPQTSSFVVQAPFLWSNTQFLFGSTAALALAAAQTRLEQGSTWEVDYGFNSDDGEPRSGDPDPASLIRMLGNANLNAKKFFDTPDDVMLFNNVTKNACVIRHFAPLGATTYELRVTLNHMKTDDPLPKIKSKSVNYSDIKYKTQYDNTDAQMFDVKVITSLSSLA